MRTILAVAVLAYCVGAAAAWVAPSALSLKHGRSVAVSRSRAFPKRGCILDHVAFLRGL
jgi:hypothetical protein